MKGSRVMITHTHVKVQSHRPIYLARAVDIEHGPHCPPTCPTCAAGITTTQELRARVLTILADELLKDAEGVS